MTFPDAPDVRFALHAATHKGLRLLMVRTLQAVGRMDAGDDAELQAALAQLDSLRVLLSAHMRHEGRVVLTAIEARQPGAALRSGQDHAALFEGLAGLHDEASALRAAAPVARQGPAQRLYRRLARLVGDKLLHMAHEEQHDSALLHRLYDDGELAEIAARLEAAVEPSVRSGLQAWMARALNPQERSQLGLAPGDGLRAGTPGS